VRLDIRLCVHENAMRAVLDLVLDEARVGVVVHFAVAERRDERRDGALQGVE
jgi:hypothetical protein